MGGSMTRFCIRDAASLNDVARFLRVKNGLSVDEEADGFGDEEVLPLLVDVLKQRALRLMDFARFEPSQRKGWTAHMTRILMIMSNDVSQYNRALDLIRNA